MKGKNWEILAPAGSSEQLVAAVHNGCDSVYLGLDSFNARMKAPNFNAENIGHWIDFCHFFGVKVYVTVNTSLKNNELIAAKQAVYCAYKNNADGVIITDLALLKYATSLPKPFDVVASTQLNIHDKWGAEFLKKLGATTVVCARESTLGEIKEIAEVGVNVECFIHGALCVCQSGQCLFSSMVGGNSGNRGLCAQPCRKLYKANDGRYVKGGYLLSASDICSLDTARSLLDAGARVFKIEGRNRRAEYAGVTSRVYSKLFQNNCCLDGDDKTELLEVYNRGELPQNNYLVKNNGGIIYPYAQNHIGRRVGTVRGKGVLCEVSIVKGDGLKVFDGKREVCGALAINGGEAGCCVNAEFSGAVKDGFVVRRTTSVTQSKEVSVSKRAREVSLRFVAFAGQKALLTLNSQGVEISVESDFLAQKAQKMPLTKADICEQLSKTGDSYYTITDIVTENDAIFIAKSQLNALRRQALDTLSQEIVERYNNKFSARNQVTAPQAEEQVRANEASANVWRGNCLAVTCRTKRELERCGNVDYVVYKPEELSRETLVVESQKRCFLDLPTNCSCRYVKDLLPQNMGVVCHNVGQVEFARKERVPYIAGSGLNIFNDDMAREFADAETFVYSPELTFSEIAKFQNQNGIVFVDGELVLMKMMHCPFKLNFGCDCVDCRAEDKRLEYTDEQGNKFAVKRRKDRRCSFELVNGKKLSVTNKLLSGGRYMIDFDEKVVEHYLNLNRDVDDGYREEKPYTKGRLYNSVN